MFMCRNAHNLCFGNLTKTMTTLQIHFETQDIHTYLLNIIWKCHRVILYTETQSQNSIKCSSYDDEILSGLQLIYQHTICQRLSLIKSSLCSKLAKN